MEKMYFITDKTGCIVSNAYSSKENLLAEYEFYPQNGEEIVEIDETNTKISELKEYFN